MAAHVEVDPASNHATEAYVQSAVRLEAPRYGCILWRNNVGALRDDRGVPVRYGLANDNRAINDRLKSADLIGIRKVLITPQHVGHVIGQFVSRECKRADWTYKGNAHEIAQMEWVNLLTAWGADAKIVTGTGSFTEIAFNGQRPFLKIPNSKLKGK